MTLPAKKPSTEPDARRRAAVAALVKAHGGLEDKHEGAIWLETSRAGVWLLGIIPTMPSDDRVDEPMEFLPSATFRYGLRLYTGRKDDFIDAIERNPRFAALVARGTPIPNETKATKKLQHAARKVVNGKK